MVDAQKNTWKHWNSLDIYTIRRLYTKIISNHVYIAHQSSKRHSSSETFSSEHKQIVHFLPMPLVQSAMLFSPKRIVPNWGCWHVRGVWVKLQVLNLTFSLTFGHVSMVFWNLVNSVLIFLVRISPTTTEKLLVDTISLSQIALLCQVSVGLLPVP